LFDIEARPRAISVAAAIILALLGAVPSHAADKPAWSYALGAAVSTAYGYRVDQQPTGTTTTSFDPGLLLSGTVTRTLTRHTALTFSTGYRRYSRDLDLVAIPEVPPTTGQLRSQYFSIGAGLRIEPKHGSGPYIQALPTIFISRWEENTVDREGTNLMTNEWRPRSSHSDSFQSVLAGIELGAGFRVRFWSKLGTDFGLRITSSGDPGEHDLGRFSSGKFHGLDELALVGGITWSP